MASITLNIPDNEIDFFIKLANKFKYTISDDIKISQEMKNLLDERQATTNPEKFIPWDLAKKQLHFKS